jgi:hypothetical protein
MCVSGVNFYVKESVFMRRRKWVLVTMGLAVLLVAGVYTGWRVTRANERLRALLLSRIKPFVTEDSGIQSLEINLSSIRLQGIHFVPRSGAFILKIEGIEIGYRFWNVIRHGFSPQNIAHEIMVVHPVLILDKNRDSALSSPESNWESVRNLIQEFSAVASVTVLDAEVVLYDSLDHIVLANDLDGWLQTVPLDSARLRLSGRFLESREKNLHLDSRINLNTVKPYSFFWTIDPSHTPESIPLLVPAFIQVKGGILQGSGEFIRGKGHSGFIQIGNGAFCFKNHPFSFEAVELRGDLRGNDMTLSGEIGNFHGSSMQLSGVLKNLVSPEMDIQVRCDAFHITPFFQALVPKSEVQVVGIGRFYMAVNGDLNNPSIRGSFHVDHAEVSKFRIDTLHMALTLQDSVLRTTASGHQAGGFEMLINSHIDFTKPQFPSSFTMDLHGNILPMLPRTAENHFFYCRGKIGATLGGPLSDMQGELSGSIQAESKKGGILRLDPVFAYSNRQLRIRVDSNNSFLCTGIINQFLEAGQNWQFQIQNAELIIENTLNDFYNRWFQDQKIISEIQGNLKGWRCHVRSISQNSDSLLWETTLETVVQDEHQKQVFLTGVVYPDSANPIPFNSRSLWTSQRIQIKKFEFGDFLSFEGDVPWSGNAPVACKIRFHELSLHQLYPLFPRLSDYRGVINGDIHCYGIKSRPHLDAQIRFSQGEFHGLGNFTGEASGSWNSDTLNSFRCRIAQDDHDILTGYVQTFVNDSLDGNFTGRIPDLGTIVRAFSGEEGWKGQSAFSMQVFGTGQKPAIKGKLVFEGGKFGWLKFDTLAVQFTDTLISGWGLRSNMLYLTRGHLNRLDGPDIDFQGKIPLSSEGNMDVGILMQGNVLRLLDDYSAFVRHADGQGTVRFRIRGRPGTPTLEEGSIQLENGTLELSEVVRKIDNLNIAMMLDIEDRFFQILNFSGMIKGRPVRIYNYPSEKELPVIRLENLGIHLGILSLETDPQGISVHIPGLMEAKERGMIAFGGLTPDEPFLIAGDESGMILQGTLRLSNTRLTYPFLKTKNSDGKSNVVKVLEKITWNLRILPLSDVHYVRSIESPLGNVYADLQLKQEFGSLQVQGMLDEGTFQVWGNLESTDGTIEVLDMFFRPERITFDYPRGASYPIVSGRSHATLIDSTGTPSSLWLTLTTVDDVTGQEVQGGSWKNIIFKLSSDNPNLARNEADLLSAIGYSSSQIRERAYDALGLQVENMVFRPLLRPLERQLRRYLGLDVVRFSSKFSSNLIQLRGVEQPVFDPKWLLRSSRVTLGKYVAPGFFIIYSGQVQTPWKYQYYDESLGFRHSLSVEYTFRPDLFLEMEYTYDSKLLHDRREDKRIWLKHVFSL